MERSISDERQKAGSMSHELQQWIPAANAITTRYLCVEGNSQFHKIKGDIAELIQKHAPDSRNAALDAYFDEKILYHATEAKLCTINALATWHESIAALYNAIKSDIRAIQSRPQALGVVPAGTPACHHGTVAGKVCEMCRAGDVPKPESRPAACAEPSDRPRRIQMLKWVPAEHAIQHAVDVVESMGGDTRLTKAVVLLGQARDAVADYVDNIETTKKGTISMSITCKGLNCGCTDGVNHSPECFAEHAAAIAGGRFLPSGQVGVGELERLREDNLKLKLMASAELWWDDDSSFDSPEAFAEDEGLKIGDEFTLQAATYWKEKFRVTKLPDDTSDDTKVEQIEIPTERQFPAYMSMRAAYTAMREAAEKYTAHDGDVGSLDYDASQICEARKELRAALQLAAKVQHG